MYSSSLSGDASRRIALQNDETDTPTFLRSDPVLEREAPVMTQVSRRRRKRRKRDLRHAGMDKGLAAARPHFRVRRLGSILATDVYLESRSAGLQHPREF